MRTTCSFLLILIMMLLTCGCNQEGTDDSGTFRLTEKAAQLINVNNQFSFKLFRHVSAYEKDAENLMVSPLSVALALAMTYNGAETSTKEAMEKTLQLYGFSREEINNSYMLLVNGLKSLDPKVLLEIANAIFYRKDFEVEKDFVSLNQKYYDAEVSALDFSSPAALDIINGWVKLKTHEKIPEILKEITGEQIMFLLNAIYFKGIWSKEFNKKSTVTRPFYTFDGKSINAEMMARTDTLDYMSNNLFSAVRLNYGSGNFNMMVFLPGQGKTTEELIAQFNPENWAAWSKQFAETRNVDILLPKLKFAYEILLNDVLSEMGMAVAFSSAADFSGINRNGGLRIDYVKHKTFIEVNEEGTEAAAVTIVAIEKTMTGPEKVYFHVDRPFLFVITEKSTGAILFMGTVKNPALN